MGFAQGAEARKRVVGGEGTERGRAGADVGEVVCVWLGLGGERG